MVAPTSTHARLETTRQAWLVRAAVPKQRPTLSGVRKRAGRRIVPLPEKRKNTLVRDRLYVAEQYHTYIKVKQETGADFPRGCGRDIQSNTITTRGAHVAPPPPSPGV